MGAKHHSCVSASDKCKMTFNAENIGNFFFFKYKIYLLWTVSNPLLKTFNKPLFYLTANK